MLSDSTGADLARTLQLKQAPASMEQVPRPAVTTTAPAHAATRPAPVAAVKEDNIGPTVKPQEKAGIHGCPFETLRACMYVFCVHV